MSKQSVAIDGKTFIVGETYGPDAANPGRCWRGKTRTIMEFTYGLGGRRVWVRHANGGWQRIKLSSFATWARDKVKIAP